MDRRQDAAVHRFCEGSFVRKARWHVHGTGPPTAFACFPYPRTSALLPVAVNKQR